MELYSLRASYCNLIQATSSTDTCISKGYRSLVLSAHQTLGSEFTELSLTHGAVDPLVFFHICTLAVDCIISTVWHSYFVTVFLYTHAGCIVRHAAEGCEV